MKADDLKMLVILVLLALMGTSQALSSLQDGGGDGCSTCQGGSYDNSSENLTRLDDSSDLRYASVSLAVGGGYYKDRPIFLGSQIARQTWIKNERSGTSMSYQVGYANSVDGQLDLVAKDDYHSNESRSWSTGTVQMVIDEDVEEGKVHVGVLKGNSSDPSSTAWKDPELEIDEDYLGTFHIEKNMTLVTSSQSLEGDEDWLACCGGGYLYVDDWNRRYISATGIFDGDILRQRAGMGISG